METTKHQLKKINDNVFVSDLGLVVRFKKLATTYASLIEGTEGGGIRVATVGKITTKIKEWGVDNSAPELREKLISANAILPNLQIVARNILLGSGIYCYKAVINENGEEQIKTVAMPENVKAFFKKSKINRYLNDAASELTKHLVAYPELIWTRNGQIAEISVKECKFIRAEEKVDGKIENYWFSGAWGLLKYENWRENSTLEQLPVYDPLLVLPKDRVAQKKFVLPIGDFMLNDGYYPIPPIEGVKTWLSIMNKTPVFHDSNLDNTYSINFHIEIPEDYFCDWHSVNQGIKTDVDMLKQAESAEKSFMTKVNKFLAGVNNSGRTLFTKTRLFLEKEWVGIKITPIKGELRDEALLKLNEEAITHILSNQGVPSVLASIPTPNRLSAGSEILNTFNMYIAMYTPFLRAQILEPLELIAEINGWDPDLKFGFKDVELKKLADNKIGKQSVSAQ